MDLSQAIETASNIHTPDHPKCKEVRKALEEGYHQRNPEATSELGHMLYHVFKDEKGKALYKEAQFMRDTQDLNESLKNGDDISHFPAAVLAAKVKELYSATQK